MHMKINIFIAP